MCVTVYIIILSYQCNRQCPSPPVLPYKPGSSTILLPGTNSASGMDSGQGDISRFHAIPVPAASLPLTESSGYYDFKIMHFLC